MLKIDAAWARSFWLLAAPALIATSLHSAARADVVAAPEQPASPTLAGGDLMPKDPDDRKHLVEAASFQATLYGTAAYLQYKEMYRQAINEGGAGYTGFNTFSHERKLAGPGYAAFKVPNSDTLYSTAWLDLSRSPVVVTIPATDLRYFTLNIFDIYGNPSNLSTRTIGPKGGAFLFVPPNWTGEVPPGLQLYRASTPYLWTLLRVFAHSRADVAKARRFQEGVSLRPLAPGKSDVTQARSTPPEPGTGAVGFLRTLDYILRTNGHLAGEAALISNFRVLGIGGKTPFDLSAMEPALLPAVESGYQKAMVLLENSKTQLGEPTGPGWTRVNKGKYGYNYIRRSVTNLAGLGANVPEENASFTTFTDKDGQKLDGSAQAYTLRLPSPPPVNAFWSVTLYDGKTYELSPNPARRYLINDRTPGLVTGKDGSITIQIQRDPLRSANWLPAPSGPFFLVIRSYMPKEAALSGAWLPPAVERSDAIKPTPRQP